MAKQPAFEPGTFVRLKSGGPKMTVSRYEPPYSGRGEGTYHCKWFTGAKLNTHTFSEADLQDWTDEEDE